MTTNLFVIVNVKQLRTDGSFRILLPFFRTSCGVGVLKSAIFNGFHSRVEFGTILEGLRNFGEGFESPRPFPSRYATDLQKAAHKLNQIITEYGLNISVEKTKSMAFEGRDPVRTKTVIDNTIVERVNLTIWEI